MHNPFPIKQINSLKFSLDEKGSAYSQNYKDIYFQASIGLDEKRHVFLQGNQLPKNWQDTSTFRIAETGFGTGLNFLATLQLWQQTRKPQQQLHYISCELHPMDISQLKIALNPFTELKQFADLLLDKYPQMLLYGFHRIHFSDCNISLTLIFGDCVDAFKNLNADIDAWYLDGFAPSKNPDMWNDSLFKDIANISHLGTTLATYTVAGKIRQGLKDVGFTIKKTIGFGQKREMLTAKLSNKNVSKEKLPWAQTYKTSKPQSFAIIGAGIAGLSLAQKLQLQDKNVTLIDRQKQPCLETSGNPQAMVMPSFDLNDSPESRFYLAAFLYATRHYLPKYFHTSGVLQLAFSKKQKNWQNNFFNRFDLPKDLVCKHNNGLLYPQSGWLDTQGHALNIFNSLDNYLQTEIVKIEYKNDLWQLYSEDGIVHTTNTLILANGIHAKKLLPEYEIPMIPKYGQISYFNSSEASTEIADCQNIQLCKGYITPSWNGIQTIGASFEHIDEIDWYKLPKNPSNHWLKNTKLWDNTPYADILESIQSFKSRAGIRVTTPDHFPICGPLINQSQFKHDYHDICHGKHWQSYPPPQHIDNIYLFSGLGSRGFTSAPILAEFLCNQMLGQPQVLNTQIQKSIHPNRFLYKLLKKSFL